MKTPTSPGKRNRFGRTALTAGIVLAGLTLMAGCNDDSDSETDDNPMGVSSTTVVDLAVADGRFTTLVGALQSTGLDAVLSGDGPFTVFAPTDAAFALLPDGALGRMASPEAVLTYHVVPGRLPSGDVVAASSAATVQGGSVSIAVVDGTVVLDGRVQVIQTDIEADNGVIHVLDAVLFPGEFPGTVVDALVASPRFGTLAGAVGSAGLIGTLEAGTYTVLAPTNAAFDRLPAGALSGSIPVADILTYHVIPGAVASGTVVGLSSATTVQGDDVSIAVDNGTVVLDGRVQVTAVDIETTSGVIHVLDSVLIPGTFPGTVVDVLAASPRFDTLVGAVVSADLAGTLAGGTFTVFAPTNAAFDGVNLNGLTTTQLADVLRYHAVAGAVDAATVVTLSTATTVEGSDIAIDTSSGVVLNGTANVTYTDILTNGGIVHVIDSVLTP